MKRYLEIPAWRMHWICKRLEYRQSRQWWRILIDGINELFGEIYEQ